ncbi:MAG: ABC transporter substrate-binding protein [Planctomycetota bacterium]
MVIIPLLLAVAAGQAPAAPPAPPAPPAVVSVLSALPVAAGADLKQRFEQAHAGVQVDLLTDTDDGCLRALRNHASSFHVVLGLSIVALDRAAQEGLLQPYRPRSEQLVSAEFRDRLDRWYAFFLEPIAIAYHTGAFEKPAFGQGRQLPLDYEDLGDRRFQGQVAIGAPTLHSLSGYAFLSLIEATRQQDRDESRAFTILRNIDGNLVPADEDGATDYSASATTALGALVEGEQPAVLALCSLGDVVRAMNEGLPVNYVIPSRGFYVLPRGLALSRAATEPARTFYEHVAAPATLDLLAREHRLLPAIDVDASRSVPWMRDVLAHLHATNHPALLGEAARWMGTFQNDIRGSVHRRFALFDQTFEWLFMILLVVAGVVAALKLTREEKAGGVSE